MKKQSNHRAQNVIIVLLLLSAASISAIVFMLGVGASANSQKNERVIQAALAGDGEEPSEGLATPVPRRKPGEPQVGEVPTPTLMPDYPVPYMTPVPIGADADFDQIPTPVVGYTPIPTPLPGDPIDVAAYPFHISNPQLMTNVSINVVQGTVASIQPARWSTKDGSRPLNPRAPNSTYVIFRPVLVNIDSYRKGSGPTTIMIMALGGVVGQDKATWGDSRYTFSEGEHVVLFLNNFATNSDLKVDGYTPWMAIEHYTLGADGKATNGYHTISTQELLTEVAAAQK
ncbi:MAG TPA: hypothetical protein VGE45_20630 [Chloroflexia bacterium]|jgi:hypothetical protein